MPAQTSVQARAGDDRRPFDRAPIRISVLVILFSAAALYEAFQLTALHDPGIWWHLRTGLWMLQNHAVPRQGLFSQHAELPWAACSWGFELLAAMAYKLLGLRAIPMLLMAAKVALAVALFGLARGVCGNFWMAVCLSGAAQYALSAPRPLAQVFSVVCFVIELIILFDRRRQGNVRSLFWLALLFLVWANLDEQFVTGLLVLLLFLAAQAAGRLLQGLGVTWIDASDMPPAKMAAAVVLAVAVTLFNPYTVRLLPEAITNVYGALRLHGLAESGPLGFRRPQDYVLALLAMAAFFALARRRSLDLFKLTLVTVATVLAFRFQGAAWIATVAALPVLADINPPLPKAESRWWWRTEIPLPAALAVIVCLVAGAGVPGREALMSKAGEVFPRKACDFIRTNHLPGPVFNRYLWGGFLIWELPDYPVAMDARLNLYGAELSQQYLDVAAGDQAPGREPAFAAARIILLERGSLLAQAMKTLPAFRAQYRVEYEDKVAIVLARR